MEPFKTYFTKEGWAEDWKETKERHPKTTEVLTDLVNKINSMKTSSACYFFAGLFLVSGTAHLSLMNEEIRQYVHRIQQYLDLPLMSEDQPCLQLAGIRYLLSGAFFSYAIWKRSKGE